MKHSEGFLKVVDDAKSRVREVSVADTKQRMRENGAAKLIDVREDKEWEAAHAAGAIHLGKGIIERDIETTVPDKNAELILYCGGGYRSALAADALQRMGLYERVFDGWWLASMAGSGRGNKAIHRLHRRKIICVICGLKRWLKLKPRGELHLALAE